MRTNKEIKKAKRLWRKQHSPLLGLLIFSIAIAVTIVACTKETLPTTEDEEVQPPDFGNLGGSIMATMFKSVGKGAMGEIGEVGMSWALSSLGLSDGSPDYTEQFQ